MKTKEITFEMAKQAYLRGRPIRRPTWKDDIYLAQDKATNVFFAAKRR